MERKWRKKSRAGGGFRSRPNEGGFTVAAPLGPFPPPEEPGPLMVFQNQDSTGPRDPRMRLRRGTRELPLLGSIPGFPNSTARLPSSDFGLGCSCLLRTAAACCSWEGPPEALASLLLRGLLASLTVDSNRGSLFGEGVETVGRGPCVRPNTSVIRSPAPFIFSAVV